MDQYCLVLTGRLLPGHDPAGAHARMAEAFGMQDADFRQRVFERAPLLIRRGLDLPTAQAQAVQLEGMGVEARPEPDQAALVWLLRAGRTRGPLPQAALDRYAEPGDQWCHDGGQQWFAWSPAAAGEPLPPALPTGAGAAVPPPIPAAAPDRPRTTLGWAIGATAFAALGLYWHALAPFALLAALAVLIWSARGTGASGRGWAVAALLVGAAGVALWLHQPAEPAAPAAAQAYVARPLQPLEFEDENDDGAQPVSSANAGQCAAAAPSPRGDEDRFLLTGGQRLLTGRAQRKGDTYVAEAAASFDRECHPASLQLYVFRGGVFIGTALENAVSAAGEKLADFRLDDEQHLSITLTPCKGDACGTPSVRQIALQHGAGGWMLRR